MTSQQDIYKVRKLFDVLRLNAFDSWPQVSGVILRVIATEKALNRKVVEKGELYRIMQTVTPEMDRFQGDEELFYRLYGLIRQLNAKELLSCFALANYREIKVSEALALEFESRIKTKGEDIFSVFIPECERYGEYLLDLISGHQNVKFTLSSVRKDFCDVLNYLFEDNQNVNVVSVNIYQEEFFSQKFDTIISVPAISGRMARNSEFICNQTDLAALQNLLYHIKTDGELIIILPARIMFAGGNVATLRDYIEKNYKIKEIIALPTVALQGSAVRTYLFVISAGRTEDILVNKYEAVEFGKNQKADCSKMVAIGGPLLLFHDEFSRGDIWNIENAFIEEDDEVSDYRLSTDKKIKLKALAKISRGISIKVSDDDGNVGMINISDITELGIKYSDIKPAYKISSRVERYLLKDGDVLVTTRGTVLKVAVFEEQEHMRYIPSSNISVIRPGKALKGAFLKLFLEAPVGRKLLGRLQRGEFVVNINYRDLEELEVPVPPIETQNMLISTYDAGMKNYTKKIKEAEAEWKTIKTDVYSKLYEKRKDVEDE